MKGGQNFRDLQKEAENKLPFQTCMVCGKTVEGFYARYGNAGVCNRACMQHQETVDKFPGHSAEDFTRRFP